MVNGEKPLPWYVSSRTAPSFAESLDSALKTACQPQHPHSPIALLETRSGTILWARWAIHFRTLTSTSSFTLLNHFIMKKLLLFVFMTSVMATAAMAQEQKDPKHAKEMKKDQADWDKKVKDELKLTDEQVAKYDALSTEYKAKIDAVLQDASLTKEVQKRKKKMALKKRKNRPKPFMKFHYPPKPTRA